MAERLIRMKELPSIVGASRSAIYEAMKEGKFPKPVAIFGSSRCLGWPESSVQEFVKEQIRSASER